VLLGWVVQVLIVVSRRAARRSTGGQDINSRTEGHAELILRGDHKPDMFTKDTN
jgi:hypothetical protein